jgi:hypothetical protein
MFYVEAGSGETRDSVDGGAKENFVFIWIGSRKTPEIL